jgi:uncharacterized membrane protein
MVEPSKHWTEYLAVAVEIAAALVIALAVGEAVFRAVPLLLRYSMPQQAKVDVRLAMGALAGARVGIRARGRHPADGNCSKLA